jgi:hypothetical protein
MVFGRIQGTPAGTRTSGAPYRAGELFCPRRELRYSATSCTWTQSQRRVHRPGLSDPPTVSFIARVTKPRGGARFILILFRSRTGSGSTRGSIANSPQQAKASRRRRLQRHRTCQFKIEPGQAVWRRRFRSLEWTHPRDAQLASCLRGQRVYAIMRRARPYRGENPAPGKDVHGQLDPTPGI